MIDTSEEPTTLFVLTWSETVYVDRQMKKLSSCEHFIITDNVMPRYRL